MNPKETAEQLIDKIESGLMSSEKKACAIIVCEELITRLPNINETPPIHRKDEDEYFQYWYAVKRELNSL